MWHGLRRFRLRRLERVNIEALLIASAQILKRLLADKRWGQRPASGMAAAPLPIENGLAKTLRTPFGRFSVPRARVLSRWTGLTGP